MYKYLNDRSSISEAKNFKVRENAREFRFKKNRLKIGSAAQYGNSMVPTYFRKRDSFNYFNEVSDSIDARFRVRILVVRDFSAAVRNKVESKRERERERKRSVVERDNSKQTHD